MAFLAALPELAEAGAAAGEAGAGAAEGAGAAGEAGGGGKGLFNKIPSMGQGEQGKQQNNGASRNGAFQQAFGTVRSALRGGTD